LLHSFASFAYWSFARDRFDVRVVFGELYSTRVRSITRIGLPAQLVTRFDAVGA